MIYICTYLFSPAKSIRYSCQARIATLYENVWLLASINGTYLSCLQFVLTPYTYEVATNLTPNLNDGNLYSV